jgi:Cu/Ag efflux pump CusA
MSITLRTSTSTDVHQLVRYGVTTVDIEQALAAANRNATAGFLVAEGQEYLIRGVGRFTGLTDIGAAVVRSDGPAPVLVRDLATVQEGTSIKCGDGSHHGRPAVIIGIQKQPGANTLELTERIDATLEDISRGLPAGMRIQSNLFRSADFIEQALNNLFTALLEGAGLVILVVLVFLMNMRAAAITLAALPLSLVAAAVVLDRFGLSPNTMSIGGLAIAIGELVDDAIIDVENVVRRLRDNAMRAPEARLSALAVVYRASTEIRASVVFATMIVAIVFVPLFLLGSVEGRLLRPLGLAYVVALVTSLVVALT